MSHTEFLILAAAVAIAIGLQLMQLLRGRGGDAARFDRIERELRLEMQAGAQATRQEVGAILAQNHAATAQQLDSMRQQIHLQSISGREEQAMLVEMDPDLYYVPPYTGPAGWIGMRLDTGDTDWDHIGDRIATSWELVAPRRLLEAGGR